jgi:Repeat of unknown function (DUF6923)
MRTSRFVVVIGFVLAVALPAAGQEVMYGSTGGGQGTLGTVDQTNGDFTLIGDPTGGSENLVGISFDSTGRLFGAVVTQGNSAGNIKSTLIEINPNNGSPISTVGPIQDSSSNDIRIVDLATQPGTDALFGIDNEGSLWTINKGTAVATLVGDTGLARGGIGFAPDGTLYLANTDSQLARLDPATGQPIATGPLDGSIDGLAVRPSDGALFGTEADGNDIYRINAATGALTKLGSPDDDTTDLAFKLAPSGVRAPALSPAASGALGAFLAAAGVVLLARRRSQSRSLIARG